MQSSFHRQSMASRNSEIECSFYRLCPGGIPWYLTINIELRMWLCLGVTLISTKPVNCCTAWWHSAIPKIISSLDEHFIQTTKDADCWLEYWPGDHKIFLQCTKSSNLNLTWWLTTHHLGGWFFSELREKHLHLEDNQLKIYYTWQIHWYIFS